MRQCDALDGLADGIINNYMACRALFDVSRGAPHRHPWAAKRCPDNVDPNPAETSASACLTDGQISTLELVYSHYKFATPLANGVREFGMWTPNTDPSGSGLILPARFRGQEGAAPDAPMHSHLGVLGVTGFLMKDVNANPLDYVEGGPLNERRRALSEILDSTNPDLGGFARRGGKLIVAIGTNDTLASPGAQLDYYQAVIDKMRRHAGRSLRPVLRHAADGPRPDRHATTARAATGKRSRSRRCRTPGIVLRCCSTGSSAAWRPACRSPYRRGRRACRSVRIRRIRSTSAGRKHRRHRTAALRPERGTICSSRNRAGAMLRACSAIRSSPRDRRTRTRRHDPDARANRAPPSTAPSTSRDR